MTPSVGPRGDEDQLNVRVPSELKFLVDEEDRNNKEVVTAALERELGITAEDSVVVIDRKIRRLEHQFQEAKEASEQHHDRAERLEGKLDELRELRDKKADSVGEYNDGLDAVLDDIESGEIEYCPPVSNAVTDIAEEHGVTPDEVHLDLKRRAADQDRDILHTRFMVKYLAENQRGVEPKPIAEQWQGGDDDG